MGQHPDCPRALADDPGHLGHLQPTEDPQGHHLGLVGRQLGHQGQRRPGRLVLQHLTDRVIGAGRSLSRSAGIESVGRRLAWRCQSMARWRATVNTQARKARSSPRNRPSPPMTAIQVSAARSSAAGAAATWK